MIRLTRRRRSKETAALERDGEELVQLDKDHARGAQRRVHDEVGDVVDSGEEATAEKTTGVMLLLPEEVTQRQPSVLGEGRA